MKERRGQLTIILVFVLILGAFCVLHFMTAPPSVIVSERRPAAAMPRLSADAVFSGQFMKDFERYAADRFPYREQLRTLKAFNVFHVFQQTDMGGLYLDRTGAGSFRPIDERSFRLSLQKLDGYAGGLSDLHNYLALVPDKSIYAARAYPGYDPALAASLIKEETNNFTVIDLAGTLTAGDYYRTDLHWDQPELGAVTDRLGAAMQADFPWAGAEVKGAGPLRGNYYGQIPLPMAPDRLTYVTDDVIKQCRVQFLNPRTGEMEDGAMYDETGAQGQDPYDFFLSGAQPLIVIDNPQAKTDRELYVFRDSFGSSIAPLLASGYARVTLIDFRYIDSRVLPQFVTFKPGSDALFLYSSQLLNNPTTLLIR